MPPAVFPYSSTATAESFSPVNDAPDPGETVTVEFALRYFGSGNTRNLVATCPRARADQRLHSDNGILPCLPSLPSS